MSGSLSLMAAVGIISAPCFAQQTLPPLVISTDKASGVYSAGDTVHWTIQWQGATPPPAAKYILKSGALTQVGQGDLTFHGTAATVDSPLPAPNTLLRSGLAVRPRPGANIRRRCRRAGPNPACRPAACGFRLLLGFKVKELEAVPADPMLAEAESEQAGVSYWKVTLDNIRGTHVQGQIARPSVGTKFPAILQMQYAGVYGLQKKWVTDYAKDGWLAMDIEAHDIPIDEPARLLSAAGSRPAALLLEHRR